MQKIIISSLLVLAVSTGTILTFSDHETPNNNCAQKFSSENLNVNSGCLSSNAGTTKYPATVLSHKEVLSQWRDYPLIPVEDANS